MDKSIENLLRFTGATVYSHLCLQAAKDLFGRSYYQLSLEEKTAVNGTVNNQVQANTVGLTPELLQGWLNQAKGAPLGFQPPPPAAK